ncbi:MAG TPA: hypothetical protein VG409_10935, partial [Actinomycetota bacterium]|nr:hypothetical protein [Actinomycetota bacterium]
GRGRRPRPSAGAACRRSRPRRSQDRALQAGLIVSSLAAAALAGLWWRRRGRTFRNVTSAP